MLGAAPQITVLIACFNTGPYLAATLESVLAQSFEDFEVIMVDDGSTDDTAAVMQRFAAIDARFSAVLLPKNLGVVAARNAGLVQARGQWVAPLDGDDIWIVDALAERLSLAHLHAAADVIATDFAWFESTLPEPPFTGRVSLGPRARKAFEPAFSRGREMLLTQPFELMATLHFAWTGAMLIRRGAITACGNFDASFAGPEDTLLWLRLALRGPFVFSPRVTAFYRQRPGSLVTTYKGPKELHYLTVLQWLGRDALTKNQGRILRRLLAECHHIAAVHFRRSGEFAVAVRHALAALKNDSLQVSYWKAFAAACIDFGFEKPPGKQ